MRYLYPSFNRSQPRLLLSAAFTLVLLSCILQLNLSRAAIVPPDIPATQHPYIINNRTYYPIPSSEGYEETGVASWYGGKFHGRSTSNGEIYNMYKDTAAHKLLPMHTMVLVTNLENGREIVVRVNDRGPFVKGRIIDLSYSAAKKLGLIKSGTGIVKVTALGEINGTNGRSFKNTANLKYGEYYVQIGAFIQKYNSLRLQKKFIDAGHRAVIKESVINGRKFHRVLVYVGHSLKNARRREKALLDKGYKGAFLIAL